MRTAGIVVLCLVLAGCGGSGVASKLKSACMKDVDMTEAECSCIADQAGKDLSRDAQAMVVAQMEDDHDRVNELSRQMSMEDAASVGTFMMNAVTRCGRGQMNE